MTGLGLKALILAAGRGSRMGDATCDQPKCFTYLNGRRLIDWQISALQHSGINEITFVTGYRSDLIAAEGIAVIRNPIWNKSNMVMSLYQADKLLQLQPTLVCYSDIVFHPDCITRLINTTASIAITYDRKWQALWEQRFDNPLTDAESLVVRDNLLLEIGKKVPHISQIEGQYMGLIKITPGGWMIIKEYIDNQPADVKNKLDITALFQGLLDTGVSIDAYPVDGRWCEVDSQNDIAIYELALKKGTWSHDWRW